MAAVIESKKAKAATTAAVTAKLTGNIGDMIDQLVTLRDRKRELEAKVAEVEGQYKGIEEQLIEKLEAEKLDGSRGKTASASITKTVTATVTDWDAVFKYVKRTGFFHLFQRRLTDTAYREILESGKSVPGVEPFVKRRLNLRAL